MIGRSILIAVVDLAVGAAVLAVYMRRDRGIVPPDRLPEALGEPMNGLPGQDTAELAPRS
jgi:hypothetical protein